MLDPRGGGKSAADAGGGQRGDQARVLCEVRRCFVAEQKLENVKLDDELG